MLAGKEWNEFSVRRVSLRISDKPTGKQRSRYFLQLPYKFSVPLITASMLLHWLISQSLFVVAIEERTAGDELSWSMLTCGYSPLTIIVTLIAGLSIPLSILVVDRKRLPGLMPVAGNCSLAIAAACHHPDGKAHPGAAYEELKWGVMTDSSKQDDQGEREDRAQEGQQLLDPFLSLEHCGLSADHVDEPQPGTRYV